MFEGLGFVLEVLGLVADLTGPHTTVSVWDPERPRTRLGLALAWAGSAVSYLGALTLLVIAVVVLWHGKHGRYGS
jgi:hypothetical protein